MSDSANKIVPILGILAGLLTLLATMRAARGLPQGGDDIDLSGPRCYAYAQLNGTNYHVKFLINGSLLHVIPLWPRFVITLDMSELHLEKKRAFIGTQVLVTPCDRGEWRMFKSMVISHYSAKKLAKISNGIFGYSQMK